jgi:hypothetical protein
MSLVFKFKTQATAKHLERVVLLLLLLLHLIGCAGEVLSTLRGDNKTVTGTNECHNSVQQRKEEARRKRRKKKRTGSSLVSSCFQGTDSSVSVVAV